MKSSHVWLFLHNYIWPARFLLMKDVLLRELSIIKLYVHTAVQMKNMRLYCHLLFKNKLNIAIKPNSETNHTYANNMGL